jgi:hypothetical protein
MINPNSTAYSTDVGPLQSLSILATPCFATLTIACMVPSHQLPWVPIDTTGNIRNTTLAGK